MCIYFTYRSLILARIFWLELSKRVHNFQYKQEPFPIHLIHHFEGGAFHPPPPPYTRARTHTHTQTHGHYYYHFVYSWSHKLNTPKIASE